jgi:hypothetical protein
MSNNKTTSEASTSGPVCTDTKCPAPSKSVTPESHCESVPSFSETEWVHRGIEALGNLWHKVWDHDQGHKTPDSTPKAAPKAPRQL